MDTLVKHLARLSLFYTTSFKGHFLIQLVIDAFRTNQKNTTTKLIRIEQVVAFPFGKTGIISSSYLSSST